MKASKVAIMALAAGLSLGGWNTLNVSGAERFVPERPGRGQILERIKERLNLTDEQDRIRGGATDEFAELVRRHQDHLFAVLYRYERDRQKLEDLEQETFLKAWRALAQFDGHAPFQHWLTRIAIRVALDQLRKEHRR